MSASLLLGVLSPSSKSTPPSSPWSSPAPLTDQALQQLWLDQHNNHVTLKHFFPKEDVISSLLVTPSSSKSSLLDKSPILLVLTFNPVIKKSPDGLGQPKLTWLKFHKQSNSFTFKKSKPLKSLQRIECVREGDVTLITPDKTYTWKSSNPALRNTFVCWLVETAKYSFNFAPPVNLDDRLMSSLTSSLSSFYLHSPSSANVSSASHRLILSSLDKPIVEEKKEVDETVILPPLSASATASILHFLSSSSLTLSTIHQLESALSSSMLEQEQQAITLLYDSKQVSRTDAILSSIEETSEKLDELSLWLSHHDAELGRMRAGIERIEGKNTRLEVQEFNHQQLATTLKDIINKLTLPSEVISTLQSPDFRGNMQGVMRAAQQLDAVLTLQLDPALEDMSAVKEQREKYFILKQQFAASVRSALEGLFSQYGAVAAPPSEVNGAVLENNAAQQQEIGKYVGLAQYLSRLDPEAYVGLRPRYTAVFARVYEAKFKGFFNDVKKLIQSEKHDSSLLSFPDFLPGSQAPALGNAHIPPSAVFQTAHSAAIRGRQSASAAFRNAVSCIIPLITKEEQFLSQFFTTSSPPSKSDAEELRRMMTSLFPHISEHLSELSSIAFKSDPFYALEMEVALDRLPQGADYLVSTLTLLQSHLKMLFNKFVDEQITIIQAINASPKRSGILPPMLKFPNFILKCESLVRGTGSSAADTSYQKLSFALFKWLEGVAKSDEKYSDVCLIENYYYFTHTFKQSIPSIPALALPIEKAAASYHLHLGKYLAWQVEYEMKEVWKFWQRLEEAQRVMGVEDIQHARDLGKHELRVVTRERLSGKGVGKSVLEMYKRIKKHLPKNEEMAKIVWEKVGDFLVEKMKWFEKSVAQSYANEKIAVSAQEVREMINKITANPPRVD